jgi:hypothetical protein
MLNNFFTIYFKALNSIARVKEVIPKKSENVPIFDLWHIFQGHTNDIMFILHLKYLKLSTCICSDYKAHCLH